jgi:MoaA/NifB/PqqE/SkfB family radical SAM enzyme
MGILYSKTKIFHYHEKLDSLPLETPKILPPLHIRIKPTNVCNHNCYYCAYRTDYLQLGKDMVVKDFIPKQKMFEIIDDLAEMGVQAVTFSGGGEPFCYPYFLDSIKRLSGTKVKFAALTNGALLKGEVAQLFAHKATWVRISMDGWDDDSYTAYRGVKHGEFTNIIKNMEDFKRMGGHCYLGVSLIVDQKNAAHIYELVKKLKMIKVDSVKISPCIMSNDGRENNKYHKPVFQVAKEQSMRAVNELASSDFEIFDDYHELDEKFNKDYSWCPYLQIMPVIGADMNVYACHDKAYNLKEGLLGSIKERRFKDFWYSDKNNFFKINPSVVCNHHCVVNCKNKMILEYLGLDKGHLEFV